MAFDEDNAMRWIASCEFRAASAQVRLVARLHIDRDARIESIACAFQNIEIPEFLHGPESNPPGSCAQSPVILSGTLKADQFAVLVIPEG